MPSPTLPSLPSIVEFHAAFHDDAHLYIVMEHCSGGDLLEKLLRDKKAMSEARVAADVALPCLAILARLHSMAIIHRWRGCGPACQKRSAAAEQAMHADAAVAACTAMPAQRYRCHAPAF